jgi:hypothetical protein
MTPNMIPVRMTNGAIGSSPSRARWATIRVETDSSIFVGRLFVPETKKRSSDVLCDDRPFLFLTEVSVNDSHDVEPFLAINKRFIKTVRVLHEGAPEAVPGRRL